MEQTIEERAYKAVPDMLRINDNYLESFVCGYCRGATEQKRIDIDKAKQAFMTSCGWLKTTHSWFDTVFDEFIKELEK